LLSERVDSLLKRLFGGKKEEEEKKELPSLPTDEIN